MTSTLLKYNAILIVLCIGITLIHNFIRLKQEVAGVDLNKHIKVSKWLQRCKATMEGYKDANQYGVDRFKALVDKKLADLVAQKEQGIDVGEFQEHYTVLVTNYEVFKGTKTLIRAVKDHLIDEEYSEMLKQLETAMEVIIN